MRHQLAFVGLIYLLGGYIAHAAELVLFEDIEDAPRVASRWFEPLVVSSDGNVVGGFSYSSSSNMAWSWSATGGFKELRNVWQPQAITTDGTKILLPDRIWNTGSGETSEIEASVLLAMSSDGTTVAGYDPDLGAFRWTEPTGAEDLGISNAWDSHSPRAMSADGSTIVGSLFGESFRGPDGTLWPSDSDGFIWRDGSAIELGLPQTIGHVGSSQVFDVSADGEVILAIANHVLRRIDATGNLIDNLGPLEGFGEFETFRRAFISSDGSVIVGQATSILLEDGAFPAASVMWDRAHGYRDFVEALEEDHGITFPQSRLVLATAISDDKTVVVGHRKEGPPGSPILGWVAYLDRPIDWILGDADHDKDVDFNDFLALSNGFGGQGEWEQGDFDLNGQIDFSDFLLLSDNFGFEPKHSSMAAVPEPNSSWAMIALAIALLRGFSKSRWREGFSS